MNSGRTHREAEAQERRGGNGDLSLCRCGGDGAVHRHGPGGVLWDGGRLCQRQGEAALLTGTRPAAGTVPTTTFCLKEQRLSQETRGKAHQNLLM